MNNPASTFAMFITDTLKNEGGYSNLAADSGGETNFGITVAVARANGYSGPMKDMPRSEAERIYRTIYWLKPGVDLVDAISPSIALSMGDIAVNMGPKRAGEFLQKLLNLLNKNGKLYDDIAEDGQIGNGTLKALRECIAFRPKAELIICRGLNVLKGYFYINLATTRPKDEEFLYGWLLNRVV